MTRLVAETMPKLMPKKSLRLCVFARKLLLMLMTLGVPLRKIFAKLCG
jgi:hypothetical protein